MKQATLHVMQMVNRSVLRITMASIAQYIVMQMYERVTLHVMRPEIMFVLMDITTPLPTVLSVLLTTMVPHATKSVMLIPKRVTLCATRMENLFVWMDITTPQPTVLSVFLNMDVVSYTFLCTRMYIRLMYQIYMQ